jgi:hypothetical protein
MPLDGALARPLARREKLAAGALSKRLHGDRVEHLVGGAQLRARVHAPALAAQPLAVEQMPAGELRSKRCTAQAIDRFTPVLAHELGARGITVIGVAPGLEPPGARPDIADLVALLDRWRRSPGE